MILALHRPHLLLAATGALAASAIVLLFPPAAAAYLAAFTLIASISLGSAAILMLFHSTGGAWGEAIRRRLENASAATPFLVLLFIPIVLAAPHLYPWFAHHDHPYLAPSLVVLRSVGILAIWAIGGPMLAAASRSVPAHARGGPRLRAACAAGLIVYFLTVTFGFSDWLASLDPDWHSSVFGVIIICSQGLTALAFVTGAAALVRGPAAVHASALRDLGSLILTLSLLHAYVAFSQFFIIWNGNVPERTSWYIPRTRGVWLAVIIAIVLVQWAIPFTAMLFRPLKTSPRAMVMVAAMLLLGAALEAAWLTLPSAVENVATMVWLYPPLAAIGLLMFFVLARPIAHRIVVSRAGGVS